MVYFKWESLGYSVQQWLINIEKNIYIADGKSYFITEAGTRNFFKNPQSQFCNFLKKCCSATALLYSTITIFSTVRNFKSATWELHFRNFQHIFGRGIRSIHEKKKSEVKNLRQLSFKASLWFPEKQTVLDIRSRDHEVVVVGRPINLSTGSLEWGALGKGRSVYE
jgi:hypothetical protein